MSENDFIEKRGRDTDPWVLKRLYRDVVDDLIRSSKEVLYDRAEELHQSDRPYDSELQYATIDLVHRAVRLAQELAREHEMSETRRSKATGEFIQAARQYAVADNTYVERNRERRHSVDTTLAALDLLTSKSSKAKVVDDSKRKRKPKPPKLTSDEIRHAVRTSKNVLPLARPKARGSDDTEED